MTNYFTIFANGKNIAEECGESEIFATRKEAETEAAGLRRICPHTTFEVRQISENALSHLRRNWTDGENDLD